MNPKIKSTGKEKTCGKFL